MGIRTSFADRMQIGIRQAILEGDIDRALELTKADYPDVLENNEYVLFRLKCRKFIEIIRSEAELKIISGGNGPASSADGAKQPNGHTRQGSQQQNMDLDDIDMVEDGTNGQRDSRALATAAIAYGKSLQAQYMGSTDPEIVETLAEIFSLFAYENPLKQREVSHLLEQKGRVVVAEELNAVILGMFSYMTDCCAYICLLTIGQNPSASRRALRLKTSMHRRLCCSKTCVQRAAPGVSLQSTPSWTTFPSPIEHHRRCVLPSGFLFFFFLSLLSLLSAACSVYFLCLFCLSLLSYFHIHGS